jgi:hypothetical protein
MLFVLAAIGAVTVAVLLWRSFGAPAGESAPPRTRAPRKVTAPDDDAEFLRSLDERNRKDGGDH